MVAASFPELQNESQNDRHHLLVNGSANTDEYDLPDLPDLHVALDDWIRLSDCIALVRFTSEPNFYRVAGLSLIETYKGRLLKDGKIIAGTMLGMGTSQLFSPDELNLIFVESATNSLMGLGGRFRVREINGCRWLEPVIQDIIDFGDAKKLIHNGIELACFEDVIAKINRIVSEE